ncbi:MAG TPA: hypothetical protein VHY91_14415 [Pirellulales bacterium]|jgi:hypothetical protein|nr:hypothetical protein [Pirellulales bacterium]
MRKAQLAAYLVSKMTPDQIIGAFDCWADNAETLGAERIEQLIDQSTSGEDFLDRYNSACDSQNAELGRLQAGTRLAKRRIRDLGG